ncbi:MAG: protein-L-isoaspartate(D-aspartate) O-methyltransferase [Candidatus Omnitrophica bacterium]|nr:protein-L-isoaspartate(D-aspartate) O-methyltransferase [Candidatus Omnitrophota bacterium]
MNFIAQRKQMVQIQLIDRGIKSERVLAAFSALARHEFVAVELINSAYEDCPLPIGAGQTISQPYMAALMTELLELKGNETVLELGTGSGYQTAILAALAKQVHTIERITHLSARAQAKFKLLGINNIQAHEGDGTLGLAQFQPYDAIIATAAAPQVPMPLIEQLKDNGKLIIPVGNRGFQTLTLIEKKNNQIFKTEKCGCVFVPLIGEKGWQSDDY